MKTTTMRMAAVLAALVAVLGLAGCGGGGGGFGGSPTGTPASPLTGSFGGGSSAVKVDGSGYMIGSVARSGPDGSDSVTFSGLVVEQGDGRWSIPFALISTVIAPTGAPPAQFTTRAAVTGTFASRSNIAFTLPAQAVPPGMNAGHVVSYNVSATVTAPETIGHYVLQGGTPVHPLTIREFDVFTPARLVGTYVTGCNFDGTIYVLDPTSAVLTADALFTGPQCPYGSGYTRRLIGTFTPGGASGGASLDMWFTDNSGNLHSVAGQRVN